jgi:hypothetical protein
MGSGLGLRAPHSVESRSRGRVRQALLCPFAKAKEEEPADRDNAGLLRNRSSRGGRRHTAGFPQSGWSQIRQPRSRTR